MLLLVETGKSVRAIFLYYFLLLHVNLQLFQNLMLKNLKANKLIKHH